MDSTATTQHRNLTTLPYDVRQIIFRTLISTCILTINAPWHLLLLRTAKTRPQLDGIRVASAVSGALLTSRQFFSEITSLLGIYKIVTLLHTRGTYNSFLSIPCAYLQNVRELVLNMKIPYVHFVGEHRVLDLVKKVPKLTKLQFKDAVDYSGFKHKTKAYFETKEAEDKILKVAISNLKGKHYEWILDMIKDVPRDCTVTLHDFCPTRYAGHIRRAATMLSGVVCQNIQLLHCECD
jgi:hypothetical protein